MRPAYAILLVTVTASIAFTASTPWDERLAALTPDMPIDYFELAEEIADRSETPAERELAERLFGLAGVLAPESLGRSACYALADMTDDPSRRRRLLALAGLVGRGEFQPALAVADSGPFARPPSLDTILALTESFSYYRRGEGPRALRALDDADAAELLVALDAHLPGGAQRYLEDGKLYRGQLRPSLNDASIVRMLRLEVALLAGEERSWSSELLLRRGEPLIEVDPDHLSETLLADPSRAYYVNGRWTHAPRE